MQARDGKMRHRTLAVENPNLVLSQAWKEAEMDDNKFPWFTEWNGIFMPVGDALGLSLALAITVVIFSLVGYLFYLLYKLVVEGFRALGRKEWGKAFAYWAIPVVPVVLFVIVVAGGAATSAAQEHQRQAEQQRVAEEVKRLVSNPQLALSIVKVGSNVAIPGFEDCAGTWGEDYCYTDEFQVTNTSSIQIGIAQSGAAWVQCEGSFARGFDQALSPGAKATIYCPKDPHAGVCLSIHPAGQYGTGIGEWCLDPVTHDFYSSRTQIPSMQTQVAEAAGLEATKESGQVTLKAQVVLEDLKKIPLGDVGLSVPVCEAPKTADCKDASLLRYTISNTSKTEVDVFSPGNYFVSGSGILWYETGGVSGVWLGPGMRTEYYQWAEDAKDCLKVVARITGQYSWKICLLDYLKGG